MAYVTHSLFVMGGTLGSGVDSEIWQCGIRGGFNYAATDPDPAVSYQTAAQAWLAGIQTGLQSWFTTTSRMRLDAKLTFAKLNLIGPDGRYVYPSYPNTRGMSATGTGSISVPSIITSAISWKTARRAGPASNGRIYPPLNIVPTGTSQDRIDSTTATALANYGKALLNALSTGTSAPTSANFVPQVVSSQGPRENITGVRVGDVIDVQRRRKNALKESYSAVVVFP